MDANEFSRIRHYLDKSQTELAQLLGVSGKAIQSFEQGWRKVPTQCERQLLFLLYLKKFPNPKDKPCWKIKACCSPELRKSCVAWQFRVGRLCWFVNGTVCQGKVQENWQQKMTLCRQCEIFTSLIADFRPDSRG
jgi:DNA-binding XRE family transcriptional regulator